MPTENETTAPEMTKVSCARCGASFLVPSLAIAERTKIVALVRSGNVLEAIKRIRLAANLELKDAKAVGLHITREVGMCHWCRKMLPHCGSVICAKCRSLNLDW